MCSELCDGERKENDQKEQPQPVARVSPCVPGRGSVSLTARPSIPGLPHGQESAVLGQAHHLPAGSGTVVEKGLGQSYLS